MIFVVSFLVVTLAVLGMAAGVLLGRRPIAGSCGGLGGGGACAACTRPCEKRRRAQHGDPTQAES